MGCGQGAAASLGQNIGVKASYINRRYDEIYSKTWWSALKGCSMRLQSIGLAPKFGAFFFPKGAGGWIGACLRASSVPFHCHVRFDGSRLVKSDIELLKIQ